MSHCQDQSQSCCHSKGGCGSHSSHECCSSGSCCCKKSSECGCCSKDHSCSKSSNCHAATKFLELADCAWMEVLKEKIKEHIQAHSTHINELARMIAEANHEIWQKKMEDKKCCGGFEEKLGEFFGHACSTHSHQGNNKQGNQNETKQGNQNKQR